jgi:hypothetical protein
MTVDLLGVEPKTIEALANLEAAANRSAQDTRGRAGRRHGSGALPENTIIALARVFRESTGVTPKAYRSGTNHDTIGGLFGKFVHAFAVACGWRIGEHSMAETVKRALKNERDRKEADRLRLKTLGRDQLDDLIMPDD